LRLQYELREFDLRSYKFPVDFFKNKSDIICGRPSLKVDYYFLCDFSSSVDSGNLNWPGPGAYKCEMGSLLFASYCAM